MPCWVMMGIEHFLEVRPQIWKLNMGISVGPLPECVASCCYPETESGSRLTYYDVILFL